jgi:hypothetical protein
LRSFFAYGNNLSSEISFGNYFANINPILSSEFNVISLIYLYNTPTNFTNVTILRGNIACPLSICVNLTALNSGNVTFEVSDLGNYTLMDYGIFILSNSSNITISNNNSLINSSNSNQSNNSSNFNSNSNINSNSGPSVPSPSNSNSSSLNEINSSLVNRNVSVNYNYLYGNQLQDSKGSRITGLFTGDFTGNKISGLGLVVLVLIIVISFLFYVRKRIIKYGSIKHADQV